MDNESRSGGDRPLVSVITMVYNHEDTLARAMDSVLCQTYDHFEYLIVDDGSTDQSGAIAEDYARRDRRVRVIHQPNGGVGCARNAGLANVTGEWVAWVDSDDAIEPQFLELMLGACLRSGRRLAMCNYQNIREGAYAHLRFPWCAEDKDYPGDALLSLVLSGVISSSLSKNLAAREVYADVRFPEGVLFEDTLCAPAIYGGVDGAILLARPLFLRYLHDGNVSSGRRIDNRLATCREMIELVGIAKQSLPRHYRLVFLRTLVALHALRTRLLVGRLREYGPNREAIRRIMAFYRREWRQARPEKCGLLLRWEFAVLTRGTRPALLLSAAIGKLADLCGRRDCLKRPPVAQYLPDYAGGFAWRGGDVSGAATPDGRDGLA